MDTKRKWEGSSGNRRRMDKKVVIRYEIRNTKGMAKES